MYGSTGKKMVLPVIKRKSKEFFCNSCVSFQQGTGWIKIFKMLQRNLKRFFEKVFSK